MWGMTGIAARNNELFSSDAHGNTDESYDGTTTVKRYTYDAYGNAISDKVEDDNPYRYCGESYDEETGLYYFRARYYDQSIGRFMSEDPAQDGLNWYVYCGNNPVMYVDPMGLSYDEVINALNGLYTDRSLMEEYPTYAVEFQEAYLSALANKKIIQNSDIYIENWSGLTGILNNIVNGDNNTTERILATRNAVQIAKQNYEKTNATDSFAYIALMSGTITLAIKGGKNVVSIASNNAHTVSLTTSVEANKLNHVFNKSEHHLEDFLNSFGGNQTMAFNAVRNAAQVYINVNKISDKVFNSNLNPIELNVNGFDIAVAGKVVDGIFKIGTFFTK
jgi:RHS repeat-associated protein